MPILVTFIVLSFSFYFFYKVKYVRSQRPVEKKWINSKASIALGLFVLLFGINQLYLYQTTITYIIAFIFILMGAFNIWNGVGAYKHYRPFAAQEAEDYNNL